MPDWEELEDDQEIEVTEQFTEISDTPLEERAKRRRDRTYRGPLSIVSRSQVSYIFHARKKCPLELYRLLVINYGLGAIVSIQEIYKFAKKRLRYGSHRTSGLLNTYWARGYVEKWAEGEWGGGGGPTWKGKTGRWFGVHYKPIVKPEDINE